MDCPLKQLPDPHISKEIPRKGELRLTSGGYPSETKIKEETGSNPYCSAAVAGVPQARRVWSGPAAVLQQRGLTGRRKTRKTERNNFIINKKDIYSETASESHQPQRPQADKFTDGKKPAQKR